MCVDEAYRNKTLFLLKFAAILHEDMHFCLLCALFFFVTNIFMVYTNRESSLFMVEFPGK